MVGIEDLISALDSGNKAEAGDVFASVMGDKINAALDDKRVEMAAHFGAEEAPAEMEAEEEFYPEEEELDVDIQELPDEAE